MSLEADVQRAKQAEAVLTNPVYSDAYADVEAGLIALWRQSRDAREREQAHQMLTMLDKVRAVMESAMRSGQVAAKELERKRSAVDRVLRR